MGMIVRSVQRLLSAQTPGPESLQGERDHWSIASIIFRNSLFPILRLLAFFGVSGHPSLLLTPLDAGRCYRVDSRDIRHEREGAIAMLDAVRPVGGVAFRPQRLFNLDCHPSLPAVLGVNAFHVVMHDGYDPSPEPGTG